MRQLTIQYLAKIIQALFLTGALLLFTTSSQGEAMTTTSDIVRLLQRQGPKLFQDNQNELEWKIARLPFQGLAVLAPGQIYTNKQHELPVIVVSQENGLRAWEVSGHLNLMFAISDVNTGKLWMRRVLTSEKYEALPATHRGTRGPKPDKESSADIFPMFKKIDALTKFDLPWTNSTLSITAICYDWVSNTTQVELIGDHKQVLNPLPVSPRPTESKNQALPSYIVNSKSPKAMPDSLSFSIDKASTNGAHVVVHGSFSKTLHNNEIRQHPETIRDHGVDQQVAGVVPITFAILKLNWGAPFQQTVNVPVYRSNISTGKATGYFYVNIIPGEHLDKGQYVIYAFMEGKVIGPQKFEVK